MWWTPFTGQLTFVFMFCQTLPHTELARVLIIHSQVEFYLAAIIASLTRHYKIILSINNISALHFSVC